ncbi:hypothetical protein [Lacimicrobium alkaliphilum]|uniref:Uncharacterized protein n=1 Tax=Lacimicrobium alkaliphilum TaxID=1526571 RepID=A0ABQ1R0P8_9ALTE|nr:hypothetical protein [Lacimicrobium alkaliphilum]GGD51056.1 hypothetical protein GCM10011357_03720 [Lacimicrobium alkaliphilum]
MSETVGESRYTKELRVLISKIHDVTPVRDSLYEHATEYFALQAAEEQKQIQLNSQLQTASEATSKNAEQQQKKAQSNLREYQQKLREARIERLNNLLQICEKILHLTDGKDEQEIQRNCARLLGTMLLITPTEKRKVGQSNQRTKHLYKAVLSLLLLERMVADNQISNQYVLKHAGQRISAPENKDTASQCPYRNHVQVPLLMTALMQDIGQYHPDAQRILKGPDGDLNEFRVLEKDQRLNLLKISYQQTLAYLKTGLGKNIYVGNSKQERDDFNQNEDEKMKFIFTLLKSSLDPQQSIGNLLKVPQVYTSVVLSTKAVYDYESLPKAAMVLEKAAEKGALNKTAVDSFVRIVGYFPQGFGITYIPKDSDRRDLDRYEYAIVTALYPEDPHVPNCRTATKSLTFSQFGQGLRVGKDNNLYYPQARKKLERMSKERLLEILSKLVSNFEERKELDLLPKCWHPYTYFSYAKHQNLWNKKTTKTN